MTTPYEVLGVRPGDDDATIRAAYVAEARRHHPDHLGGASPAVRARAEARMAEINAAWAVLRDPTRRAAVADADAAADARRGATIRDSWSGFTPLDDDDDGTFADVDFDDTPTGAPPVGRVLALVPATLVGLGIIALVLGVVLTLSPLLVSGLAAIVAGAISFVLVPVFAMVRSSRAELADDARSRNGS